MWYKNIAGRFFGLVTKDVCYRWTDGQTDKITTPKTALSIARAAKILNRYFSFHELFLSSKLIVRLSKTRMWGIVGRCPT